jgi:hypothetical protein
VSIRIGNMGITSGDDKSKMETEENEHGLAGCSRYRARMGHGLALDAVIILLPD